jgi:RNA polymerase sigma-70 factor (ECF subfamily)
MTSIEGLSLPLSFTEGVKAEIDLAALVETHARLLFRVAHSVLRSSSEAEDVVQDAFVRVLEHRNRLSDIRDMRVWLTRIAWNLAIDRRRRIRPEQFDERFADDLAASSATPHEALHEAQRIRRVLREMERLPRAEHYILLLSAIEDLTTAEIATVLGKTESAVRALLFRARTRLRERLEKGGAK